MMMICGKNCIIEIFMTFSHNKRKKSLTMNYRYRNKAKSVRLRFKNEYEDFFINVTKYTFNEKVYIYNPCIKFSLKGHNFLLFFDDSYLRKKKRSFVVNIEMCYCWIEYIANKIFRCKRKESDHCHLSILKINKNNKNYKYLIDLYKKVNGL